MRSGKETRPAMAIVDLKNSAAELGFVRKALKQFGLPSDVGAAIAALASTIRDHRHLETLLTSCNGEERQIMYDSIVPHLHFKAKPLDRYIASAGHRAEREQWPILENCQLKEFRSAQDVATIEYEAQKALAKELSEQKLVLTCGKCTFQETFYKVGEETNGDVVLKARRAGWIYDYRADPPKEICRKCPTSLRRNG